MNCTLQRRQVLVHCRSSTYPESEMASAGIPTYHGLCPAPAPGLKETNGLPGHQFFPAAASPPHSCTLASTTIVQIKACCVGSLWKVQFRREVAQSQQSGHVVAAARGEHNYQGRGGPIMRLAVASKAYMAVTLGAAIELKEQVAKPCTSAAKRRVPVLAGRSASSAGKVDGGGVGARAAEPEESLRMVMYLSCWGPS